MEPSTTTMIISTGMMAAIPTTARPSIRSHSLTASPYDSIVRSSMPTPAACSRRIVSCCSAVYRRMPAP